MITVETNTNACVPSSYSSNSKYLNISSYGEIQKIPITTILYIESNCRKITVYTPSENYDCYEKLSNLEQILKNDGFIRCHQSYLVQIDKIISFNSNNTISLYETSSTIPVSRRHQREIQHMLCNPDMCGTLVCLNGPYRNAIIKIRPEQPILIGRDGNIVDLIINLPPVSRKHCEIIYHKESMLYEITDFSTNGTYINGDIRIIPYEPYVLKPGTIIGFGNKNNIYKLG